MLFLPLFSMGDQTFVVFLSQRLQRILKIIQQCIWHDPLVAIGQQKIRVTWQKKFTLVSIVCLALPPEYAWVTIMDLKMLPFLGSKAIIHGLNARICEWNRESLIGNILWLSIPLWKWHCFLLTIPLHPGPDRAKKASEIQNGYQNADEGIWTNQNHLGAWFTRTFGSNDRRQVWRNLLANEKPELHESFTHYYTDIQHLVWILH